MALLTDGVMIALVGAASVIVGAWLARRAARKDATSSAAFARADKSVANGVALQIHGMDADERFMATLLAQVTTLQERMDRTDTERETVRVTHDGERATWRIERDALRKECQEAEELLRAEIVATRQELMVAAGRIDKLTALLDQEGTRKWLDEVHLRKDAEPKEGP